jgi:dTDP-4-dehydrorhamnose reductase
MRVLVTGATGMLGHALLPVLSLSHQVTGVGVEDFDIRDEDAVRATFAAHDPELVLHLAAYTNVDGCETDPQTAEETNGTGTRIVAEACGEIGAAMLYVGTDYVFDGGQAEPYSERDHPNPINAYGRSKLLGEQYVQSVLDRHFIARTSWLFGPNGRNFVTTILDLADQQEVLRVVNDQRGSPTYTRHLALKLLDIVEMGAYAIYHITGSGSCSWFEFAQSIVELWPIRGARVIPISTAESGRAARRPANSVLENQRLRLMHMALLPHWKSALAEYLDELKRRGLAEDLKQSQDGNKA